MGTGVKLSRGRRSRSKSRGAGKKDRPKPERIEPEQAPRLYTPPKIEMDYERDDVPESLYVVNQGRPPSPESQLTYEEHLSHSTSNPSETFSPPQFTDTHEASRSRGRSYKSQTARNHEERSRHLARELSYHSDVKPPSPVHRKKLNKWYQKRFPVLSKSLTDGSDSFIQLSVDGTTGTDGTYNDNTVDGGSRALTDIDGDYLITKQAVAFLSIALTAAQLLVLMMQLTVCGLAPFDVNGFIGPYPDAFSEWGGKNAYLMKEENEWWRLVSPSLLHIGILHLLANAFCQLDAVALFEREWGSFRWLIVYLVSSVGCTAFSSAFDPDSIAVGSSGALMGMYGAKLAQVTTLTCFDVRNFKVDEVVQLDQLSSVLCGLTLVSLLSSFSYIDWSGHMGGLLCGFMAGVVLFSNPIERCCSWFIWVTLGVLSLTAALAAPLYFFVEMVEPDEDIADACEYFRSLFPEGYDCNCMWE